MPTITELIELVCNWCVSVALDDKHGYNQYNRWGNPDYDCSSLVITAWQSFGVPVKTNGATYTGNMLNAFLKSGFKVVHLAERKRGDVLLNTKHHTALYLGDEKIVHASISENGTISGKAGDQTGKEICIRSYYNYPWEYCLRYVGNGKEIVIEKKGKDNSIMNNVLKRGSKGLDVSALQLMLNRLGFTNMGIDGLFGDKTYAGVIALQKANKLEADGIVGVKTWAVLNNKLVV